MNKNIREGDKVELLSWYPDAPKGVVVWTNKSKAVVHWAGGGVEEVNVTDLALNEQDLSQ